MNQLKPYLNIDLVSNTIISVWFELDWIGLFSLNTLIIITKEKNKE